jgi:hypothetical protein
LLRGARQASKGRKVSNVGRVHPTRLQESGVRGYVAYDATKELEQRRFHAESVEPEYVVEIPPQEPLEGADGALRALVE